MGALIGSFGSELAGIPARGLVGRLLTAVVGAILRRFPIRFVR